MKDFALYSPLYKEPPEILLQQSKPCEKKRTIFIEEYYKNVEAQRRNIIICNHCYLNICAVTVFHDKLVKSIKMPNQPFVDVLQDLIKCPRCENNIILGERRMTLDESIAEGYAHLKRLQEQDNDNQRP